MTKKKDIIFLSASETVQYKNMLQRDIRVFLWKILYFIVFFANSFNRSVAICVSTRFRQNAYAFVISVGLSQHQCLQALSSCSYNEAWLRPQICSWRSSGAIKIVDIHSIPRD